MILIGLTGYAGSGKDTVADILVRDHGFAEVSLAAPLKRMYLRAIGVEPADDALADLEIRKRRDASVRVDLQRLGTAAREELGEDVWTEQLLRQVDWMTRAEYSRARIVVPDVRYLNEAEALRRLGVRLWRVERPGVGPVNSHASEQPLEGVDLVLDNGGSVEVLHALVREQVVT